MSIQEDVPQRWQGRADDGRAISPAGRAARRSHELSDEDSLFMRRLAQTLRRKGLILEEPFETSRAEIMRQLMTLAGSETFP